MSVGTDEEGVEIAVPMFTVGERKETANMKNNYINLKYLIQYHPYHISTFAGFANVPVELLEEAFKGEEELTRSELLLISRYTDIPVSVLECPKLIILDRGRYRHQVMIKALRDKLLEIWSWQKRGSKEAEQYMKYYRNGYVNMELAFLNKMPVPYVQYLGIRKIMENALLSITCEQMLINKPPRGVRKVS